MELIEDQVFDKINFSIHPLQPAEYEYCTFVDCDFSPVMLFNFTFIECTFENCNFSNANVKSTSFKDVIFRNCKMLGVNFTDLSPFLLEMKFEKCYLNLSSFYQLKIKNTVFNQCSLEEVDFGQCDLTNSSFNECDLNRAIFDNTIIEKSDFSTAYNISLVPENNYIKKATFSKDNVAGLLDKYDIKIV